MSQQTCEVGDIAPQFNLDGTLGKVNFHDIIDGRWTVLVTFTHANDPVSTTDLGFLMKLNEEFEQRNVFIVVVGNDTVMKLRDWISDIEELQTVQFSLAIQSDPDCSVLEKYGCARKNMIEGVIKPTSIGCFIIDMDKRIRHASRNSPSIGRNWYEILRQLDGLLLTTYHRIIIPSNWGQGQDVMIHPQATTDEAGLYRFVEVRPWFRITSCPDKD